MSHMTWREKRYRRAHLSCVRHITLDPKGPGVVRIHMIPPRTESPEDPFLLLLNGAQLVPLTLSWAVLLANFMDRLEPFSGCEISEEDWAGMVRGAVDETHRTYPRTDRALLQEDLELMLRSLVAIAQGREPDVAVGALTLGEYADKMSAPHRMDLMVSAMTRGGAWHCNQKCLHCYAAGQPMGESRELTTAEWKDVLARLRAANIPQVTFTGGEPTLRGDLVELVDAAQWFVTRLNTNGRLLTPQLCRALAEASLDSVQVTLYAADAEAHNALVGAPGFDETVRGIRNAVDAGLIVSVNTPLCSLNRDYAATLRFAAALGVRYATCSGLIPSGGAEGAESRATRLSAEELTEILQSAVAAAHELSMELDFTSPGWLPEQTLRALGLHLIPSCGACLSNMAVAPDGTVIPCQSWLGGTALGNILTDDWPAIWDGEACRAIRAESAKMEHICQLQTGNRGKEGC
ncbi:MAG: radical SAM protein [Oscillospiraceae bacterium]